MRSFQSKKSYNQLYCGVQHECEIVGHVEPIFNNIDSNRCWCFICLFFSLHPPVFFSFMQSWNLLCVLVLYTFRVGLPFSLKSFCKYSHRHAQKRDIRVILSHIKLIIKINNYTICLPFALSVHVLFYTRTTRFEYILAFLESLHNILYSIIH